MVWLLPLFVDDLKCKLQPASACSIIRSSWECGSVAHGLCQLSLTTACSSLALWVWTAHPGGWSFSCRTRAAQTEGLYRTRLRSVHSTELLVSCGSAMGSWTVSTLGWACGWVCSCTHFKTTWVKLVYNSTPPLFPLDIFLCILWKWKTSKAPGFLLAGGGGA